ncbi:SDR family NAD(P)-dependent oxidoreductase [Saccharopolyspora sp. CA-218241]|uniref:SDR family NAD(P)-dependent oxidoreductase n=1 Tax=Saccharopolyspora sp. CA-218241 TaxID=3240027 RepID=UPI003D972284
MHRLDDKTAVITGAAGGIGSAAARLMAAEGARVLLADLDLEHVDHLARTIREEGGNAVATTVDVLDENSIAAMIDKAVAEFGGLHVLCNHVGGSDPSKDTDLLSLDLAEWDRVMDLNVRSTVVASRLAIPHMIAAGGGSIINTASVAGVQGDAVQCAYGTAKAGVISLTRYIATQYGPRGVRCNAIAPGATMTPALRDNLPTEVVDEIRRNTSLRSIGEPADIGHAMVHLASDESRYTTGQLLVIDGGLTTQSAFAPGRRGGS